MHFCVIAPTRELERYARRTITQLCLAQYAKGSDPDSRAYFEWYRGRVDAGDIVILDNGAYEAAGWDPDEYLALARELKPTVLTLPDKVGDWEETQKMMTDFESRSWPELRTYNRMVVVQQHPQASLLEWTAAYKELNETYEPEWIAFPRILGDRRVELIAGLQRLEEWNEYKKHHAFGMNAGSLDELPKLNTLGVFSCDSSAPVWRGLCGYDNGTDDWPDYAFDPHDEPLNVLFTEANRIHADCNLTEVLRACQAKSVMPSPIVAAPISSRR